MPTHLEQQVRDFSFHLVRSIRELLKVVGTPFEYNRGRIRLHVHDRRVWVTNDDLPWQTTRGFDGIIVWVDAPRHRSVRHGIAIGILHAIPASHSGASQWCFNPMLASSR